MLLTNKYYDHKNFHIVCYLCVVHHNGISITIDLKNLRVYKCIFTVYSTITTKAVSQTFNHNVTLVYCKGD